MLKMAEIVQLHLESFIPELEQMERIGLFSHDEIKKVIKKRKALEYRLRRRTKTKEDYLKYIQYEVNVLSLIAIRRQRLRCQLKRREIDHSIATRINKLFKAAIARNQNDEVLWLTQIQFCQRMKWHHSISALFMRMLQVHNDKPELWVTAAKWEFEENHAPENARKIFQKSVKFHSHSRLLWTEYFRMELMFVDLILKRKEVLGLQGIEDSKNDVVLQGKVALTVYRCGTKQIPDPDFAVSLIKICRLFDFSANLIDEIYEDIQCRHPLDEVTLDAVARRPLFTQHEELKNSKEKGIKKGRIISEREKKVCALYEEALEKVKSEKMWSYYIEFVIGVWNSAKGEKKKSKYLGKVLELMEQANSDAMLSASLFMQWCNFLEKNGDEDSRCSVALEAARKWPKMVSLWVLCLTAHIQAMKENISAVLDEAMEKLSAETCLPVWKLGMQWLSVSNPSKLTEYFEKGIKIRRISAPVKEMYLEATVFMHGIQAARELYKRLRLCPVSPELFRKMIYIERLQMKSSVECLRRYFEDAIKEYGSEDVDFWVELIQLELEHPDGDVLRIDMYHWRALKSLTDENTESFVTKYTLLTTGHKEALFR